ncbi:hypothetical protein BXY66_1426 [Shimia isoporae]|uniref:Lipid-binding SYLF domain-containing protein n=1 Tax=Shimia isoporae TaxID=647720 RepID=A0A4R1NNJ6_9RHOB|nr:hypothetical protein [Shimia isoporae]TCL09381.1 hypothetical protein BXY66_1426 [Shimia isoporae]
MSRSAVLYALVLMLGAGGAQQVQAENAWQKIKRGAAQTGEAIGQGVQNTGEAIGEGAQAVGGAINKGAQAVGDSLESTGELLSNEETPEQTRARLDAMSDQILARLLAENADAAVLYEASAGFAAFDTRRVTVFPVSAGYGRGVAVAPNGDRTYMNMGTGGVGAALGIGGFETQFVILFETRADFDSFVVNGYDATAGLGSMSGDSRDDETVRFVNGRSFFLLDKRGWRVNANAEGTKYWRSPELN